MSWESLSANYKIYETLRDDEKTRAEQYDTDLSRWDQIVQRARAQFNTRKRRDNIRVELLGAQMEAVTRRASFIAQAAEQLVQKTQEINAQFVKIAREMKILAKHAYREKFEEILKKSPLMYTYVVSELAYSFDIVCARKPGADHDMAKLKLISRYYVEYPENHALAHFLDLLCQNLDVYLIHKYNTENGVRTNWAPIQSLPPFTPNDMLGFRDIIVQDSGSWSSCPRETYVDYFNRIKDGCLYMLKSIKDTRQFLTKLQAQQPSEQCEGFHASIDLIGHMETAYAIIAKIDAGAAAKPSAGGVRIGPTHMKALADLLANKSKSELAAIYQKVAKYVKKHRQHLRPKDLTSLNSMYAKSGLGELPVIGGLAMTDRISLSHIAFMILAAGCIAAALRTSIYYFANRNKSDKRPNDFRAAISKHINLPPNVEKSVDNLQHTFDQIATLESPGENPMLVMMPGKLAIISRGVCPTIISIFDAGSVKPGEFNGCREPISLGDITASASAAVDKDHLALSDECDILILQVWSGRYNLVNSDYRIKGHKGTITSLEMLTGPYLASGCGDMTVRVWNIETFECLKTYEVSGDTYDSSGGPPTRLAFLDNGVLVVGFKYSVTIIKLQDDNVASYKTQPSNSPGKYLTSITAMAGMPGGISAVGFLNGEVLIRNLTEGTTIRYKNNRSAIRGLGAFGNLILSGSNDDFGLSVMNPSDENRLVSRMREEPILVQSFVVVPNYMVAVVRADVKSKVFIYQYK